MDRMSFNVLVPVLLCVVIAGVVDAACFEEDSPFTSIGFNGEGVCSNDPEITARQHSHMRGCCAWRGRLAAGVRFEKTCVDLLYLRHVYNLVTAVIEMG